MAEIAACALAWLLKPQRITLGHQGLAPPQSL